MGLVVGALSGNLIFNDADTVFVGTVLPTAFLVISAAVVGYFIARSSGSSQSGA